MRRKATSEIDRWLGIGRSLVCRPLRAGTAHFAARSFIEKAGKPELNLGERSSTATNLALDCNLPYLLFPTALRNFYQCGQLGTDRSPFIPHCHTSPNNCSTYGSVCCKCDLHFADCPSSITTLGTSEPLKPSNRSPTFSALSGDPFYSSAPAPEHCPRISGLNSMC